jgi:two-component system, LytTR family, sensor kinase
MKKYLEVIVNLIIWIKVTLILYFWNSIHGNTGDLWFSHIHFSGNSYLLLVAILSLIGPFLNFYLFYLIYIPQLFIRKKFVRLTIFAFISSFITGYSFRLTWGGYDENHMGSVIIFWAVMALFCGIFGGAMKGFFLWLDSVVEKRKLEKQHLQSKNALLLLQARLNPHFLFNSLNNIDILIEQSPDKASEYLKKLSDILRYVLYETKVEETGLAQEIAQIESYIDLQKIRTSNARYVNFNITGELKDQKIAPMIFIPFVENAFKHCKNKTIENAIDIQFDVQDNQVKMICNNYFEPSQKETIKNEGLGNETIQQRLNLIYPKNHELTIDKTRNRFLVTLSIQLRNGH